MRVRYLVRWVILLEVSLWGMDSWPITEFLGHETSTTPKNAIISAL
jgi:hypothetical protein